MVRDPRSRDFRLVDYRGRAGNQASLLRTLDTPK